MTVRSIDLGRAIGREKELAIRAIVMAALTGRLIEYGLPPTYAGISIGSHKSAYLMAIGRLFDKMEARNLCLESVLDLVGSNPEKSCFRADFDVLKDRSAVYRIIRNKELGHSDAEWYAIDLLPPPRGVTPTRTTPALKGRAKILKSHSKKNLNLTYKDMYDLIVASSVWAAKVFTHLRAMLPAGPAERLGRIIESLSTPYDPSLLLADAEVIARAFQADESNYRTGFAETLRDVMGKSYLCGDT
ncbi:MAG: hypothetical protein ACYCXT_00165 [Acidiferrobacteraceae bacterium]